MPPLPTGDWTPYNDWKEFETVYFLFTYEQMSAKHIDKLFNIWEASLVKFDAAPPFTNSDDMYNAIDLTPYGDAQWESFTIYYNITKDPPRNQAPAVQKTAEYDSWFHNLCKLIHNIIANCAFDGEFNYTPYQEYDCKDQHP